MLEDVTVVASQNGNLEYELIPLLRLFYQGDFCLIKSLCLGTKSADRAIPLHVDLTWTI